LNEGGTSFDIKYCLGFLEHCLLICFTGAETEINKIKDNSKIKREKNLDRRGPRTFATLKIPILSPYRLPLMFFVNLCYKLSTSGAENFSFTWKKRLEKDCFCVTFRIAAEMSANSSTA
jgi:hypothetical protein